MPTGLILLGLLPTFLISLVFGGPLGEEIGWRGYTLPRLQAERSPFTSALTLSVVWGLWHLPLFFITGTTQILPRLRPVHAVGRRPLRTLHPHYNSTAGSLLIPVLLHATINFFAATLAGLPASEADGVRPFLLYTLLVCLLARSRRAPSRSPALPQALPGDHQDLELAPIG